LAEAGRYKEALRKFNQLRRLSRSYKNSWGIGQSLINAGVAAYNGGDRVAAERLYARAVEHGKRSHDQMLRGRALSNLSQLLQNRDIDRAERLLDESLKAKAAADDSSGMVAGMIVRGNLAVARDDFAQGARLYGEASRAAARLGLLHEEALSTYNRGRALQDLGKMKAALRHYAKARALAAPDGYTDILLLSVNALGSGAFEVGQYKRAHRFGVELLALARRINHQEYELGALHMLAVSSLAIRGRESAREFRAGLSVARERRDDKWTVKFLVDSTRSSVKKGAGLPDPQKLRQIATSETAHRCYRIAGKLWEMVARINALCGADQKASDAYGIAIDNFTSDAGSTRSGLAVYRNWSSWAWQVRRYDEALRVLSAAEVLARQCGEKSDAIAAMDQRGVCLQELGRHAEAESLHRAAASAARRIGDIEQEERSLNNLGEALRHLDRLPEAIRALRNAERVARTAQRYDSAVSMAHNRALALEAIGKPAESARLLRRCRDEAARRGLWQEYVTAWEALANLTWSEGKPKAALALYRRAQREARERRLLELEPRIALNFARLLRSENKGKIALRKLEPLRHQFDGFVDSYQYFGTLAHLYADAGRTLAAAAAWDTAKSRACAAGDIDYTSYCASQRAYALASLGRTKLSQATLREALETEREPERRANLLIQQLELLLSRKSSKLAQATLDEAMRLCTEHGLHDQRAELYLLIGDHDLSGAYDKKFNAFKAYTMAMMISLEFNLAGSGEIASHVLFKIAGPDSPLKDDEATRLLDDLHEYLAPKASNGQKAIKLLLWPFAFAAQLFPFRKQPRRLLAAVGRILRPERLRRYLGEKYGQTGASP
jgi:tetratricopeptide (TPR) repeat protein